MRVDGGAMEQRQRTQILESGRLGFQSQLCRLVAVGTSASCFPLSDPVFSSIKQGQYLYYPCGIAMPRES